VHQSIDNNCHIHLTFQKVKNSDHLLPQAYLIGIFQALSIVSCKFVKKIQKEESNSCCVDYLLQTLLKIQKVLKVNFFPQPTK
jgi:hypothetical protein